jgi:hypothetical protein
MCLSFKKHQVQKAGLAKSLSSYQAQQAESNALENQQSAAAIGNLLGQANFSAFQGAVASGQAKVGEPLTADVTRAVYEVATLNASREIHTQMASGAHNGLKQNLAESLHLPSTKVILNNGAPFDTRALNDTFRAKNNRLVQNGDQEKAKKKQKAKSKLYPAASSSMPRGHAVPSAVRLPPPVPHSTFMSAPNLKKPPPASSTPMVPPVASASITHILNQPDSAQTHSFGHLGTSLYQAMAAGFGVGTNSPIVEDRGDGVVHGPGYFMDPNGHVWSESPGEKSLPSNMLDRTRQKALKMQGVGLVHDVDRGTVEQNPDALAGHKTYTILSHMPQDNQRAVMVDMLQLDPDISSTKVVREVARTCGPPAADSFSMAPPRTVKIKKQEPDVCDLTESLTQDSVEEDGKE